jgi:hypothetical protein
MRTKIFYVFTFIVILACEPLAPENRKFLPLQNDAAIVANANYVTHNTAELIFETELVVLNSFYVGFDNDYLLQEDFQVHGDGTYTIESFALISVSAPEAPLSVILLIDQSGTYQSIDPYNTRSQVINKFLQDIVAPDKFLTGAATRAGKLSREPVEFHTNEFGNEWQSHSLYLYELSTRTGGTAAMRDGAYEAMQKLADEPETVRRELVLLVHANDETSMTTSEDLISMAHLNNIAVNVISFGDEPDKAFFSQLAMETGGLYVICPSEKEIGKVFSELERLINQERKGYRLRIRYKPAVQGILQPGTVMEHTIEIIDPYSRNSYNPVFINIKIPS